MTLRPRDADATKALLIRLRRVEGQVRGLQRLVDEGRPCLDILTQVAAAAKALDGVALLLLDDHLRRCLSDATGSAVDEEALSAASTAIRRLVNS